MRSFGDTPQIFPLRTNSSFCMVGSFRWDHCGKLSNLTALVIALESCPVIIPLHIRSSILDLYAFKTVQLTNWQMLMRHILRYWKSATLLQDSGKEKFHIHFICLETLQLVLPG
jgi:hypothetical protein